MNSQSTKNTVKTYGIVLSACSVLLFSGLSQACTITVKVNNPSSAESIAHVTKLGVKVKGGTWRNIQEGGKRILSGGQTYTEKFKPTIAVDCDSKRRYRAKVKCKKEGGLLGFSSTVSKGWRYEPGETSWTTKQQVEIDAECP